MPTPRADLPEYQRPTMQMVQPLALPTAIGPADSGPTRVLVVDDHGSNVDLLAKHLTRLGYEVAGERSGLAALERIGAWAPDVVLLDVMMPDVSGLDVLRMLRRDPGTVDLPVILVSGLGETDDIVDGLELGANDYVTKPLNIPVLQARLATQAALKRARDDLKRTAQRLAGELDRQAHELRVAGHVQRSILPRRPPRTERLAVAWRYDPATEVGGDLFDVIPLPGGRTLLFVADAMGHGVQAALVVSSLKGTLRAHLDEADDLPCLLTRLDEAIGALFDDRFVTAAACVVDPDGGTIRYALAGHPPLLIAGREGVAELQTAGLPLGTSLNRQYEQHQAPIEPGTALLLYSDGVTEAHGPDGPQFGQPALVARFGSLAAAGADPQAIVSSIRADLDDFRGPVPLVDDLTLLAARLL